MNVDQFENFIEAWRSSDLDAIMMHIHDDCKFESSIGPRIAEGKMAVRAQFAEMLASGDSNLVPGLTIFGADGAALEWSQPDNSGNHPQALIRGCDVYRFADGKIIYKSVFRKISDQKTLSKEN